MEVRMKQQTKITLDELLRRKEQMLEAKKTPKRAARYVKSLDGTVVIESPGAALVRDARELEDGDAYLVYNCVTEPPLKSKELQAAFGCVEPLEIVEKIFDPGEIAMLSVEAVKLAGYIDGVQPVEEIKNG
jgi:hypothetical protein